MDDDQLLELDVELPSGNIAHAKLMFAKGGLTADCHFDRNPGLDDIECFDAAVRGICRRQFGMSLSLLSAKVKQPEKKEWVQ